MAIITDKLPYQLQTARVNGVDHALKRKWERTQERAWVALSALLDKNLPCFQIAWRNNMHVLYILVQMNGVELAAAILLSLSIHIPSSSRKHSKDIV